MKKLQGNVFADKQELKARNKSYKVTLEYCEETCDDVDTLFIRAKNSLHFNGDFSCTQLAVLQLFLDQLNNDVKDVGTRKLRQAFTDYVLENQKD